MVFNDHSGTTPLTDIPLYIFGTTFPGNMHSSISGYGDDMLLKFLEGLKKGDG
jgi:hypothetical protein